jgi:hypothetical protein
MQHNSFGKHDLLLGINNQPLVRTRREPHRNVGRDPEARPQAGQFALEGAWSVESVSGHAAEQAAAADLEDFLRRLEVAISQQAPRQIRVGVTGEGAGFTLRATPEVIELSAVDAAALWAGLVHLENEMRTAGGPFLRAAETSRRPAWEVQICPPSWGANFFVPDLTPESLDDEVFRSMAHQGINGMLLYGDFLAYAVDTRFPELEHPEARRHLEVLKEASERALRYGIRFYYVAVSPKLPEDHPVFVRVPEARGARLGWKPVGDGPTIHCLCSSSAEALGFHADMMRNLFTAAPELGGVILIVGGESYYHCYMRAADSAIGETNCAQCRTRAVEELIGDFVEVSSNAVKSVSPQAQVMVWPYTAHWVWSRERFQLKFIDELPANTALLSEVEKDQNYLKDGYSKLIWDYSVDYGGPSDRIVAQTLRCSQQDRDFYIKTETAHGIELLHFPYVPCLGRSARKWQGLRTLRPRGVLQRWGFVGAFDSVAERIGYEACWDPEFAPPTATAAVAAQLMGAAAPEVVRAWDAFDRAVGHIPTLTIANYYIGPMFLGPAHPLPTWEGETPEAFLGTFYYLVELEATFTEVFKVRRDDMTMHTYQQLFTPGDGAAPETIVAEFERARDHAEAGWRILHDIDTAPLPPHCRREVEEQLAIGEYLYRNFRTTVNTLQFLRLKADGAGHEELVAIARDELENSIAARRIYEVAPWLSHHLRLDIGTLPSIEMVDAKVELLREYVQ